MSENARTEQASDEADQQKPGSDESAEGSSAETVDAAEDPLAEALARADENWNKYLRLAADMENLRKRAARDTENARKYGVERFASELLSVVDSLEMGLEAGESASAESLREGSAATLKLLLGAMEKSSIVPIDPEGEPFDPELHEAMTMQPSETAEPGSVLTVIQKGYQLNGRLLRPARVIVAGAPESGD